MNQVQLGNTVRIHYVGTLEDGKVIGSTAGNDPIEIQPGRGTVFPKMEEEVLGMSPGEEKTIILKPEEAFGLYRSDLVTEIPVEEFTNRGIQPFEGLTLDVPQGDGKTVEAKITRITDEQVQLDANHPWAGRSVTFAIQVVEIV